MIPWEQMSGDEVERLIAALISVGHPRANRITPSRGDRGMDVVDWCDDGSLVVYQVKRYTGPLRPGQVRDIESSLHTMLDKVAAERPVSRWHLVMPWSPTPERVDWLDGLRRELDPIDLRWDDRARLDAWAASQPQILDFFVAGRGSPRDDLLVEALRSKLPDPDALEGSSLLGVAEAHLRYLNRVLDRIDPFYRYDIRHFFGPDAQTDARHVATAGASDAVATRFVTLEDGTVRSVSIRPKTALAQEVSPLTIEAEIRLAPENRDAVQAFHDFGTPVERVPARIVSAGPPGFAVEAVEGFITLTPTVEVADLPDTEIALVGEDGADVVAVELGRLERTRSPDGRGARMVARSRDEAFLFTVTVRDRGPQAEINVTWSLTPAQLVGLAPHVALRAARAAVAFNGRGTFTWRQAAGGSSIASVPNEVADQTRGHVNLVEYLEALLDVQRVVSDRLVVPDLTTEPDEARDSVLSAARLLRGETLFTSLSPPVEVLEAEWTATPGAGVRSDMDFSCHVGGRRVILPGKVEFETATTRLSGAAAAPGSVTLEPEVGYYALRLAGPPSGLGDRD